MDEFTAGKFLFAKLFRTIRTVRELRPDYDAIKFFDVKNHSNKKLSFFGGMFVHADQGALITFGAAFSLSRGASVSGIPQFAVASTRCTVEERVWAFLSVIDYLITVGELPLGALENHVQRITKGGMLTGRKAACTSYGDFCERAAKDLPYDLSLEVLSQAA